MKDSVIGIDIAKQVFQLHTVNQSSGTIERINLRREEVLPFFANYPTSLVAIEACGSAHWWARQLQQQGHEVRLLAPRSVRPFVLRNKTDAADAQAIWTAVQQPGACLVAIKQADQQAILSLHRIRAQLLKFRIMQSNGLRGLLYEFGIVLPEGYAQLSKSVPEALVAAEHRLPSMLLDSLRDQWARVIQLDEEIRKIELRLKQCLRESSDCQKIAEIPGIGLLTATAAVASLGDAKTFNSGRQFAAWLGLVPRQTGTGGRVRQLGLSKRGDTYLRTLLMHAARSILNQGHRSAWAESLLTRRPYNVVVAAVANKLARTLWAVLAKGSTYRAELFTACPTGK
ncbi:IS110 family transposase [Pseudomonas lalucatii]|uniref:IS110 family transposase n=1 Tax=Pseudomonas lalucatii TaxID=1424203 RepID=A0ABS5PZF1_9PSED|nr:IS110 family transposase [Pseudomonas lalucatii]MBS7661588.1 IS110 family transposase [Pseudomonas lalucatii]MBS7723981.1 IS110 family transposase [Pseudomonas lalucatii]QVM88013.1 IS110 family transposase [Pseudomonas lalucatii]